MNGEYEWIKVSPLQTNHIYQLETLEVLSEVSVIILNSSIFHMLLNY